jgi:predicted amidohydrolase
MRILLTAMACPKGDIDANLARHLDLVATAGPDVDLVLFPEMSLTGYLAGAAIALEHPAVRTLVERTADAPAICFGFTESAPGKPYITQVVAADGAVVAVHRKAHLGDDERDDFQPGTPAPAFTIAGETCAIAVCAEIGSEPPYRAGGRVVLAPAAPGLYGPRRVDADGWQRGYDWWHGATTGDAARLLGPDQFLALSTQAGATIDEDFPGWAALIGPGGAVISALPDWHEGSLVVEVSR